MSGTIASLRRKIDTAGDLRSAEWSWACRTSERRVMSER